MYIRKYQLILQTSGIFLGVGTIYIYTYIMFTSTEGILATAPIGARLGNVFQSRCQPGNKMRFGPWNEGSSANPILSCSVTLEQKGNVFGTRRTLGRAGATAPKTRPHPGRRGTSVGHGAEGQGWGGGSWAGGGGASRGQGAAHGTRVRGKATNRRCNHK